MNRARSLWLRIPVRRTLVAVCIATSCSVAAATDASAQGNRPPQNFPVLPVTITGVTVQDGQLFANGLVGTNPFQTPLLIGAEQANGPCPILNLQLGPIDLNLLGLRVQTSPICLDLIAVPGGGLLGDILCSVAGLLQGGAALPDVLAFLETTGNLDRFLNGLTVVLNQTFDRIGSNESLAAASCSVLSLALGPIDLNLLGLVVELDDCARGPVTVDITAIPGGGLLGDLLCSLGGSPLNNPSNTAVQRLLEQIAQLLGQLLS
jgi:hypothetical protein